MSMETPATPTQIYPDLGALRYDYETYSTDYGKYSLILAGIAFRLFTDSYVKLIMRTYPDHIPDMSDIIASASGQLEEAISTAEQEPETNLIDLFRARAQLAFVEQRVIAPLAYSKPGYYNERRQISNGAYGLNHELIEELLERMDNLMTSPNSDDASTGIIRGIINEQTTLALLNRTPFNRIAVPSDTLDDLTNKTDIVYWYYTPKGHQASRVDIQVKSSSFNIDEADVPKDGILVTAYDLGNSQSNLRTARLIAWELADGEGLNPDERVELDRIHDEFMSTIAAKLQQTPGVPVTTTN